MMIKQAKGYVRLNYQIHEIKTLQKNEKMEKETFTGKNILHKNFTIDNQVKKYLNLFKLLMFKKKKTIFYDQNFKKINKKC